jgi:hypothetical protein
MIPAVYLPDIMRGKKKSLGSHIRMWALCFSKCPSFVEERLCTVSSLRLHNKKNSGAGRYMEEKKFAGVGRVSSSIFFDSEYFWQMFPPKISQFSQIFTL